MSNIDACMMHNTNRTTPVPMLLRIFPNRLASQLSRKMTWYFHLDDNNETRKARVLTDPIL